MRAVERRAPVIYQAAMFDGRFVGFADFLVLDGERYRLRDTKLARSVKVEALLQLAAYADTLAEAGVPVADEVELVLGDGATDGYRVDELLPVYRRRRAELQRLLDDHLAGGTAGELGRTTTYGRASAVPECTIQVRDTDDLLLVAGMRVSQRARLIDAGITTIAELARARRPGRPSCRARTVASLTAQARLQIAPRVDGKPPYEVADPQPLMLLPDPNKGDLFFDFEGDPLWTADGREWGLEYLWGVLDVGRRVPPAVGARPRQRAPGARRLPRDGAQAPQALPEHAHLPLRGLREDGAAAAGGPLRRRRGRGRRPAAQRRARRPLSRWCARAFGSAPRTTASSRSSRCTWAPSCAPARSPPPPTRSPQYARYCELRDDGPDRRGGGRAQGDRGVQPLRLPVDAPAAGLADGARHRIRRPAAGPAAGRATAARSRTTDDLARTLTRVRRRRRRGAHPEQTAVAMIAAARGYHRREDKPFWWAHFDRLNNPVDEWGDTSDVFVADEAEVVKDWHLPPHGRASRSAGCKLDRRARGRRARRSDVFALYDPPSPAGLGRRPRPAGVRQRSRSSTCDDPEAPTEVIICEREPKTAACSTSCRSR